MDYRTDLAMERTVRPGGMGAGVVPLSGMYAEALGQDSAVLISRMIPASTLGNVSAIVGAGLLAKLGSAKPSLTGNGQLMRKSDDSMKETIDNKPDYQMLGIGLILAMTFYILGVVVGKIVPAVHAYSRVSLKANPASAGPSPGRCGVCISLIPIQSEVSVFRCVQIVEGRKYRII